MFNMNILWVSQKNAFTLVHIGINWYQHSHSNNSSMNHRKGTILIYTFLCVLNVTEWSCKTRGGTLAVIHLAHDIHVLKSYSPLFKWKPHTVKQCYEIQKLYNLHLSEPDQAPQLWKMFEMVLLWCFYCVVHMQLQHDHLSCEMETSTGTFETMEISVNAN